MVLNGLFDGTGPELMCEACLLAGNKTKMLMSVLTEIVVQSWPRVEQGQRNS